MIRGVQLLSVLGNRARRYVRKEWNELLNSGKKSDVSSGEEVRCEMDAAKWRREGGCTQGNKNGVPDLVWPPRLKMGSGASEVTLPHFLGGERLAKTP